VTTPHLVLDFTLVQGQFTLVVDQRTEARAIALVGPSGAGKTSALEAIAGLRTPDRGEIALRGIPLYSSQRRTNVPPHRRRVGYVPQDVSLFPHLSVRGNILYGSQRSGRMDLHRVLDLLEIAALIERQDIHSLSGGERQRVAVARAIMADPLLLLFDEPLAGVDAGRRRRIVECLGAVHAELGVPMIYVTHDLEEARSIADWVVVLDAGRVRAAGRPVEVIE
jgi:molybdate transport system ATP-binding protein